MESVAGPPGFEPGTSGSEGPRLINQVSRRNHQPGNTPQNYLSHEIIITDSLETPIRERLIASTHIVSSEGG